MTADLFHREAAAGRWFELSLMAQLGNIGTEAGRAARAREAGNESRSWNALVRALELFDLTIADERWRGPKLREICRAREVVCDFIAGDNEYGSTAASIDAYFLALRLRRSSPGLVTAAVPALAKPPDHRVDELPVRSHE